MADDFVKAVDDGLKLAKRLNYGKDRRAVIPPKPQPSMLKDDVAIMDDFGNMYIPRSPMMYAVVSDPGIVDNPDMPSYQPYVHGRCDPPALIPLQMNGVEVEIDCFLDTAFVRLCGSWRVHCVMGSRFSDCRLAVPMGQKGSLLRVEVELPRKSYCTELIAADDNHGSTLIAEAENGGFLKPDIFLLTVPQVNGGTNISVQVEWSQKLLYSDGQFTLNIPFSFPGYVTPNSSKVSKREKIQLNVNSGPGTEVLCKTTSHSFKEVRRQSGKLAFLYEAQVLSWSKVDLNFSFAVSSSHIFGGVLLQSPSVHENDQREMFSLYLFPGNHKSKVFRKEVVFVIDISGSMQGKPIEDTKNVLFTALSQLNPGDSFSIIAFNGENYIYSSKMERASEETVNRAIDWIGMNFIAGGGTNILHSLSKAIEILSNTHDSIPIIFFVTDGTVEDERQICNVMKGHIADQGPLCPRIYTFGIGSFCNHYFLQMLAMIGRGHYDAALDVDSTELCMQRLFRKASSNILANINIDTFANIEGLEVFPSHVPDLSYESPLIISGRYQGKFPENVKLKGVLADMSDFVIDLKTQMVKDIPLDKLSAKQWIDLLTAQAWFSQSKELEQEVAGISLQTGFPSEYTSMALCERDLGKKATGPARKQSPNKSEPCPENQIIILLQSPGICFGDLDATLENIRPGAKEEKLHEGAEIFVRAASNCCQKACGYCCCMCCIQACSRMNNQCAIVLSQLCAGLACLGCFECCSLCCGENGN